MPDKNNSKFMSILEKSGIIRKADGEDDDVPAAVSEDSRGFESDIRPLFDHQEDAVTVRSAPKQPIPGFVAPVFPSDNAPAAPVVKAPQAPVAPPAPAPAPVQQADSSRASAPFGGLGLFKNGDTPTTAGLTASAMESALNEDDTQPESYTDRFLNIDELYEVLALRSKKTDTIYLIEDYLSTLPGSLPDAQRREIVSKLLASSGFDFDLLMGDGVLRVKMLKEYAERFARHTDDYIAARQAELDQLDQQMARTRRLIENRKELHKKQFYTIEAEAQRLKEILTFISG